MLLLMVTAYYIFNNIAGKKEAHLLLMTTLGHK